MKNLTTLSLITATIIGLTGCGGGSSTTSSNTEVTSIQKLSNASSKHTKSDWLEIENYIHAIDNTEAFNTMLLGSIDKNIANLNSVGVDKEEAYAVNSDLMYDDLIELDISDLDNQVVAECKDNETCKEEAYSSLSINLTIDKEEAYGIAIDIRGEEKGLVNDKLVQDFKCETGEVKTVQHYGLEDLFSTSNGVESTTQRPADINQNMLNYNNNVNAGFAPYDESSNNRLFLDHINNLPASVTSGRFYIGLKSNGRNLQANDTISLGDLSQVAANRFAEDLSDLTGLGWSNQLVSSTNPTTDIYWNDLSNISLGSQTLLTYVQNNQRFDAYVQDDTSVDFITVATCSKPDPIKEISQIVNKFECSEKETMLKILGGEIDNFAAAVDPTTPRTNLVTQRDANTVYPGVDVPYDYTSYDHHFIDTLNLGLTAGQSISKAHFNIGYKIIGSSLASNDAIYVGDFGTNHAGGHLYDTTSPIIPQGWNVSDIINYGHVANVDLLTLQNNSTNASGMVGSTMQNNNYLDVYVQDDTAVDFTQLNLCVKDNCDEDAKDIELDLSQLASWTTKPTDAVENNPIPTVWDDSLNWIEFTSKETNGQKILEIPFCACSNTIVNINSLKADNSAVIKLDSNPVVTQNAAGQASMRADNNGGVNVNGSLTLPAGTNGGVNRTLRVEVTNQSSWFGVGIDGTLKFRGNLGKCK